MVNNNRLDAQVNITTGGSHVALKQAQADVENLKKKLDSGAISIQEYGTTMARLARTIATAEDSIRKEKQATATLDATLNKDAFARRKAEAQAAADSAKAVEDAEKRKRQAVRESDQAAQRLTSGKGANFGAATSGLPTYMGASNTRIAALEAADLKAVTDANKRERKTQQQQQSAYESYVEASNKRIAAQEKADLRGVTAVSKQEFAAQKAARRAAQSDAAPGATSALPGGYLASRAAGLPTENLGLPDAGALNQTRYALYDVATTLGVLGAALIAAGGSSVLFATQYETAIAQLSRTTQLGVSTAELGELSAGLIDLSEAIPVGFEDLSSIASLGAQLGIVNDDLESFSETVAEFSAVAALPTERVAQDFGAIGQLLDVTASEYKNLGSAINFAGINSVATDAEILSLTTSIAASANQAGFAAAETVGLSSALASLRIAPEQARGVILRLFADFDRVTSVGGAQLESYSKVLKTTTAEATALWESDPEQFFSQLLKGLSTAQDLNATLRELGITETRESNVLQRLAGNYDTYTQSIQDATGAYANGTFLSESFAVQADTVAARVQILVNTIENLLAAAGESLLPVIKPLLEIITNIIQTVGNIPAPILSTITAVTLLAGGLTLIVAGGAAFIASMFAVQTALVGIQKNALGAATTGQALRQTITQLTTALGVNSAAARINNVTVGSAIGLAQGHIGALRGKTAAMAADTAATTVATGATRGFGAALLATPIVNIVAGLSIAVPLLFSLASGMANASAEVRQAQEDFIALGGGISALNDALAADNAAGISEGYSEVATVIGEAEKAKRRDAEAAATAAQEVENLTGRNAELTGAADTASSSIERQTQILGKNTEAFIQNALAQDENLKKIAADPEQIAALTRFGVNIPDLIQKSLGSKAEYDAAVAAIRAQINKALLDPEDPNYRAALEAADALDSRSGGIIQKLNGIRDAAAQANSVREILGLPGIAGDAALAEGALGGLEDRVKTLFGGFTIQNKFLDDMDALNASLAQGNASFDEFSAGGRANLGLLENALASAAAYGQTLGYSVEDSIAQALFSINGKAIDTSALLQQLASVPAEFRADLDISAVISKYNQIAALGVGGGVSLAAQKSELARLQAQRAALLKQQNTGGGGGGGGGSRNTKKAQDSVKTLEEYVRDLGSAMKAAFDKRFGLPQAMDDVAAKFNSIAQNIANAKKEVRDLTADLQTLAADRVVLEAQLVVAEDYGDTQRAGQIRAELEKNKNESTDKTADLADATARSTAILTGNTEAAIANRAAVLGLISAYQGQIEAYAATGKSAAQVSAYAKVLQGQFQQQLTQLGFNAGAVANYAKVFDTLGEAVRRVPLNKTITVTANTSGASSRINSLGSQLDALDAQIAKANGDLKKAKAAGDKVARGTALRNQVGQLERELNVGNPSPGRKASLAAQIAALEAKLASGNYARGGVIGGGGRPTNRGVDDTLIMAQMGEGMVTQKAMEWLGSDGLNAINNRMNPFPSQLIVPQGTGSSSSAGVTVVELSAYDRAVQKAILDNIGVTISASALQRTVNAEDKNAARRRTR